MGESETGLYIRDNTDRSRYEAEVDGQVAFLEYKYFDNRFVLTHTEVPDSLRGQGIAHRLVQGVLDRLRLENRTMEPLCPFVLAYVKRHPQYLDVVVEKYRNLLTKR